MENSIEARRIKLDEEERFQQEQVNKRILDAAEKKKTKWVAASQPQPKPAAKELTLADAQQVLVNLEARRDYQRSAAGTMRNISPEERITQEMIDQAKNLVASLTPAPAPAPKVATVIEVANNLGGLDRVISYV